VTESENHPGWNRGRHRDFYGAVIEENPDDYGGDFTMQKSWVEEPVYPVPQTLDSGWYKPYVGAPYEMRKRQECAILPLRPSQMPFPTSGRSTDLQLQSLGSTAIARCAPRNNVANLAASLLETYHDGLPHVFGHSLWKARTGRLLEIKNSVGDEYLNLEFGAKPLLSDVRDFSHGVTRLNEIYEKFARGSGKVTRRRYDFPSTEVVTEDQIGSFWGIQPIASVDSSKWYVGGNAGLGRVYRTRRKTVRQWFSGAFTYYVPPLGDSFVGHANQAVETLGLDLNIETLWEIAPWSWAVDWFSNVGDLIHNAHSWSADGLVLKYGYIMEHSVVRDTYTWSGDPRTIRGYTYPSRCTLVTETKLRRRATPFGFGLSGGLTNRQKAIAAALGLTRT
jgi:hypothetical protein